MRKGGSAGAQRVASGPTGAVIARRRRGKTPGANEQVAALKLCGRCRLSEVVALQVVTPLSGESRHLLGHLDALGGDGNAEPSRHADNGSAHSGRVLVVGKVLHKRAVYLEPIDAQFDEMPQRRAAGPDLSSATVTPRSDMDLRATAAAAGSAMIIVSVTSSSSMLPGSPVS